MWQCKYCKEEFNVQTVSEKANHSRWCVRNPKRKDTQALKNAQRQLRDNQLGVLKIFTVHCHECQKLFSVKERTKQFPKKERYFCSRRCANAQGGRAKAKNYRTIGFQYHNKKCIVCGEDKIVAIHHYDHDHSNDDPKNLVPLCPTHHQYVHSQYAHLISDVIDAYVGT